MANGKFTPTVKQIEELAEKLPNPKTALGLRVYAVPFIPRRGAYYHDHSDHFDATFPVLHFERQMMVDRDGGAWFRWVYTGTVAV